MEVNGHIQNSTYNLEKLILKFLPETNVIYTTFNKNLKVNSRHK